MAGNTRGKLKEHFEGIHRNFDWCTVHINKSLELITTAVIASNTDIALKDKPDRLKKLVEEHPLYKGIKSLGTGIQTLDDLAQQVYSKL